MEQNVKNVPELIKYFNNIENYELSNSTNLLCLSHSEYSARIKYSDYNRMDWNEYSDFIHKKQSYLCRCRKPIYSIAGLLYRKEIICRVCVCLKFEIVNAYLIMLYTHNLKHLREPMLIKEIQQYLFYK